MSNYRRASSPRGRLGAALGAAVIALSAVAATPSPGVAATSAFSSSPGVVIPDGAYDGTVESMVADTILATGIPAGHVIEHVYLYVNIDHVWLGDLTIKLRGPDGTLMTVLNRPGSSVGDDGTDDPRGDDSFGMPGISFYDEAPVSAETLGSGVGGSGTPCADDGVCAFSPAPDTAATPPGTFADAFNKGGVLGNWTLYVGDSVETSGGELLSWSVTFEHEPASEFTAAPSANIPDDAFDGTLGSMLSSTVHSNVAAGRVVTDVWIEVAINHSWAGDLTIKLKSPEGSILTVLNRPGSDAPDDGTGQRGNFANLSAAAPFMYSDAFTSEAEELGTGLTSEQVVCLDDSECKGDPAPDTALGQSSFAGFDGEPATGAWTLYVGDSALTDTGVLESWTLSIESVSALAACSFEPFTDVAVDHPFCPEILWMLDNGISGGFDDGTYRPSINVTRQAMAAFMARLANAPHLDCVAAPFPDVAIDHPFCPQITWMKDEEISTGFGDGTYRPSLPVTRQAMSAFMARFAGGAVSACVIAPFSDVALDHPFCPEIKWMRDNGISTGFTDGTYKGSDTVTRQAMSAFMYRVSFQSV